MKTCIIIPTYDEAKSIRSLLASIKQQGLDLDVIVVDDGSSDRTGEIARNNGATVLRSARNEGKGYSLRKGIKYALSQGFDAVITMDGDGQHLPEDIPYFIRLAAYSDSGFFIGNRMSRAKNMPQIRFITNKIMSKFISFLAQQDISDTQCGFRLIKKEVLSGLNLTTAKYETESEIIIQASRLGFRIESVPIQTVYRGGKSQIHPFVDTLRFIKFIIRELWTTPL